MTTELNLNPDDLDPAPALRVVDPNAPTERQLAFARSLYREIGELAGRYHSLAVEAGEDAGNIAEAHLAWQETSYADLGEQGATAKREGKRAFSSFIDTLITIRDGWRTAVRTQEARTRTAPAPAATAGPDVPAGRYAVENSDGVLRFYKVDRPTEGRWAGYVFVKVQASDDEYPVRNREERERILAAIAEDTEAALVRYGREIGRCGVCGRTLTDETSRALGIGPVCREGR